MPKVLIADDQEDIRFLYSTWLRREGFDVVTADDGSEAVATAETEPFDLVLLDIRMPVMDGIEACRRIRQHDDDLPIVMVSVMARPADVARGFDAGADAYLPKPVTPREITLRLRELGAN